MGVEVGLKCLVPSVWLEWKAPKRFPSLPESSEDTDLKQCAQCSACCHNKFHKGKRLSLSNRCDYFPLFTEPSQSFISYTQQRTICLRNTTVYSDFWTGKPLVTHFPTITAMSHAQVLETQRDPRFNNHRKSKSLVRGSSINTDSLSQRRRKA